MALTVLSGDDSDDSGLDSEGERVYESVEDARAAAERCRKYGQHDASLSISLNRKRSRSSSRSKSPPRRLSGGDPAPAYIHSNCQYDGACDEIIWAHDPVCTCPPEQTARCVDHIQSNCIRCYRMDGSLCSL
jgi:hypothetical protein